MWQQIQYFFGALLAIPFLPVLVYQGKRVRATIPDLGEAQGETIGRVGAEGELLRLLTLGESTFAGVGVTTHEEGITAELARLLTAHYQRPVEWRVLAKSGYTAKQVHDELLPKIPAVDYDIIVIGLGGNETFQLNRPLRW
ncbi:MAG: GDSL-type esterase/lipase family protein, partial [Saprospiraceae bacterium]